MLSWGHEVSPPLSAICCGVQSTLYHGVIPQGGIALLSPSCHQCESLRQGPSPEELPEVALTEEKKLVTLGKSLHLSQPRLPHLPLGRSERSHSEGMARTGEDQG